MSLLREYQALAPAPSETEFVAIDLSPIRRDFLAKSKDGSPVFLIQDASAAAYAPGLKLENVSIDFHVTCRVQTSIGSLDDQFAVVSCDSTVPELYELFICCFAAAASRLSPRAVTAEIRANLQGLLDLFRSMSQPSGRAVIGLWAELFVIARSSNIPAALNAWRVGPLDRFDFSWPDKCLEVKATSKTIRAHEFALEQLRSPIGGRGYVASLLLQQLGGGIGVMDLAKDIEAAVKTAAPLRQKLWENIGSALGSGFSHKLDARFDISYAERNLCLYAMTDVPAPATPLDSRITSIRFQSDLSSVQSSLPSDSIGELEDIFLSVAP